MIVLAHRAQDIREEIPLHIGVELDVRDCGFEQPFVSHDPNPRGGIPSLREWLQMDLSYGLRPLYALNIKADGIEEKVVKVVRDFGIEGRSFVFDMSFPSLMRFRRLGMPFATRVSEHEHDNGWGAYLWMDRWDWHDANPPLVNPATRTRDGQWPLVAAVSPELHSRNAPMGYCKYYWNLFHHLSCGAICTDHWQECFAHFEGKQ